MASEAPAAADDRKDRRAGLEGRRIPREIPRRSEGAVRREARRQTTASLVMTAHAEDENHLHFVIPAKPKENLDELSDEDLEKVAGGTDAVLTAIAVAITIGASVSAIGSGVASAFMSAAAGSNWITRS
jgi:hypothetical protein